ncbi:MAG TPA: choice-of-anchor Q domain-containing protein [Anaerolineaceae bacterium]|nr:choice-of-anchor Q domain-containing protein [Anaerolineaceae bacterium]
MLVTETQDWKEEGIIVKILKSIIICLIVFLGAKSVVIAAPLSQTSTIHYVKSTSSGSGDCSGWDNACGLQDALDIANPGDEIWVAAGTYYPSSTLDRAVSFQLKAGVAIYGGFPADGGEWFDRNWSIHVTTLSGDIGNPGDKNDNSYHVVTATNVDASARLDGFTITAGNGNGTSSLENRGGGMVNAESSPTLANLALIGNSATTFGGGIYNRGGTPFLTNITFASNSCTNEGCGGGGMYNYFSNPSMTNITFSGNIGYNYGGGIYNFSSDPTLTNVTFSGNTGNHYGGGIYNRSSNPTLTNVTIYENIAYWNGNGIYNDASNPTITNSIIYGNTGSPYQIANKNDSTTIITYSDIEGGYSGTGNINTNPILGPLADNGGFTRTRALGATSPAIDKGNPDPETCPTIDQRGYSRPIDGDTLAGAICDMGAYEYGSITKSLRLSLVVFGSGSVVPPSNESWYPYGTPVTLTATANPGHSFASWIGFGTNNPLNLTILEDTIVTAYFTQDEYALSVVPEGAGMVEVSPLQHIYFYGTEVTLTPIPDPGWTFTGWGGDASGTANPLKITMDGSKNITANFTQDEFSLTTVVVPGGFGSVTLDPKQDTYHHGDTVTLAANAVPDWAFTGWGGDATGTTNPLTITINDNTNITANFKQVLFKYFLLPIYK